MRLALALTLALLPAATLADEVWTTEVGDIVYEADLPNGLAALSVPMTAFDSMAMADERGMLFVPGLAGNGEGRIGYFDGFWTGPDIEMCDTAIVPPNGGKPTRNWGTIRILFDRAAFPTGFSMQVGYCFWEHSGFLRAEIVTG